jgi:LPS O-antigen subunit length determinant protein (WzzB/FepE family)
MLMWKKLLFTEVKSIRQIDTGSWRPYNYLVNRLRVLALEDDSLQSALQQLGGRQLQHVIELLLLLSEEAEAHHASKQGVTLKHATGILRVERQQLTGSL